MAGWGCRRRGAAVVGVAGDGAAAVAVGVVEDVVDVPVDVVVGEQGSADTGGACADPGLGEVVGGGEDAVGVVVDVGAAVAVAVDTHGGEGGGHELHQALCAGRAGVVVAAVAGFFHADAGQQRPRNLVLGGCGEVQLFDLGRDGQRRIVQRVLPRPAGLGQVEPDAALSGVVVADGRTRVGGRRFGAGWDGAAVEGRAAVGHEPAPGRPACRCVRLWKCRWMPVAVPVDPSTPSRSPGATTAPGRIVGVDAGQVPVAGA